MYNDKLSFIYNRHSVRRFKDTDVPNEDIMELIKAATYAPCGKLNQNYHFVVIKNKDTITNLAHTIESKNADICSKMKDANMQTTFSRSTAFQTAFKNAPVVILVYAGPYIPTGSEELKNSGASPDVIETLLRTSPGIQNVSIALENLMLAAANMGYGTCWMTGPNYAAKEISSTVGFNMEGYNLMAITPLGVPEEIAKNHPPRKPVENFITFIE